MMPARLRPVAARAYRALGRWGRAVFDDPPAGPPGPKSVPDPAAPPWLPLDLSAGRAVCNVCRWQGDGFVGRAHVERAFCPACGSNGRDRFLHWCLTSRVDLHPALRVVECSPRLRQAYRDAMATWFFYRTTDFDQRLHRGDLRLDLQAIDLPDDCLDVVLCSHVLEHVPDTGKALDELHRVVAPGGHVLVQVPVLQGHTAPPIEPEHHADHTPVFWRFGFDLTKTLRSHGFDTELLCTSSFARAVRSGEVPPVVPGSEFDVAGMVADAIADDLVVVADDHQAATLGFEPGYMFLTWDCQVPPT
jgi:SAM-dependent methyltransferase